MGGTTAQDPTGAPAHRRRPRAGCTRRTGSVGVGWVCGAPRCTEPAGTSVGSAGAACAARRRLAAGAVCGVCRDWRRVRLPGLLGQRARPEGVGGGCGVPGLPGLAPNVAAGSAGAACPTCGGWRQVRCVGLPGLAVGPGIGSAGVGGGCGCRVCGGCGVSGLPGLAVGAGAGPTEGWRQVRHAGSVGSAGLAVGAGAGPTGGGGGSGVPGLPGRPRVWRAGSGSEAGVDRFGFQGEDREDGLVDAPQGVARDEAVQCFQAQGVFAQCQGAFAAQAAGA
ncbi:hypothetical protein NRB56_20490 [Nocardia sp. RB56]|uniref:Uncharacterized protein n=1 Tax=Nocardia aurantia TaxID=2585199 RepID=A0A7K0DLC5_9NOCA|nr:hypothetical protein [Nocardia aurantia]